VSEREISCPIRVQELLLTYTHTKIDHIERKGFSVVINRFKALIVNPNFDWQSKEALTTPVVKFGSKCELSVRVSPLLYFPLFLSESLFLSLSLSRRVLDSVDDED
jgi:hypothetical protein